MCLYQIGFNQPLYSRTCTFQWKLHSIANILKIKIAQCDTKACFLYYFNNMVKFLSSNMTWKAK